MRALLSLFLCLPLAAPATAADYAAAFLHNGMGARGLGMGGAFAAAVDDATAAHWNPAGLALSRGRMLVSSIQPLSLDRLQNSIAFSVNARGGLAFGFAWAHAGVGGIEGRTGSGFPTGSIEDSENAFYVAVGFAPTRRLALGFSMKRLSQEIDVPFAGKSTASGHGFDLGAVLRLGARTQVAATARHLNARLNWKVRRGSEQTSSTEDALPRLLVLGLAHRPLSALLLAADLETGDGLRAHLGAEWRLSPLLSVRAGLHSVGGEGSGAGAPTAGLSLRPMRRDALQFHYTWMADPLDAGARSIAGLSLQF